MAKYDNDLRKEIMSLPTMARFICNNISKSCETVFSPAELRNFNNIVITGCGDSLCAAYAIKECYELLLGPHIDTPACIDFGCHYDMRRLGAPGKTLVILVSFSGKVSRVVECAQRARKNGAVTMAVTHHLDSPVAAACDRVLQIVPEEFDLHRTPGCRTYVASMLGLYMFGIHMSETLGNISSKQAGEYRAEILNYVSSYEKVLEEMDDKMYELAEKSKDIPYYEFLSSGSEFATAWFSQAKIYEATGDFSRYENFEDWTHVDYILRKMDSGMFLYATKDNTAMSRAIEVASVLTRQNYRYLVLTDAAADTFPDPSKVFTIPSSKYMWLNPLMQATLPCMFAASLSDVKKTAAFCSDMIDTYFPFGGSILRNSKIEVI